MTFDVVFLGTGAAVPVPSRGTTSQFLDIHGHTFLIDAGEGVQLALRNNKRRFQKLKGMDWAHMGVDWDYVHRRMVKHYELFHDIKDHERAALRVAACEKAIDALTTGGDAGVSAVGAGACGDVLAAAPAPYVRFPSLKAALDAALMPCTFQIRFAFPARKRGAPRMTQWYKVDDLVPVCAALSSSKDWNGIRSNHSWVFESKLYRAMEDAACASSAVFAGTRLTEIAGPSSLVIVFDPTKECKHDQTYTIWAGVDFEIMMPDGTVISKSEFLLQELEKYMAARA